MSVGISIRSSLLLVGAAASWGVGTVISKQVLDELAPMALLTVQLTTSTVFLATLSVVMRTRVQWSRQLLKAASLGFLNPGLAYALGLVGLTYISASTSVLLWAAEPVLILVLAIALLGERPGRKVVMAMAIAVAGVLMVVFQPGVSGSVIGVGLTLTAVALCAFYTVAARALNVDDSLLTVTLLQQGAALLFALAVSGALLVTTDLTYTVSSASAVSPMTWVGAIASGILYYALAFWLYLSGLRHVKASTAGTFLTLIPVFGVAAAHLVGERMSARQWVGAALVIAGVSLVVRRQAASETASASPTSTSTQTSPRR